MNSLYHIDYLLFVSNKRSPTKTMVLILLRITPLFNSFQGFLIPYQIQTKLLNWSSPRSCFQFYLYQRPSEINFQPNSHSFLLDIHLSTTTSHFLIFQGQVKCWTTWKHFDSSVSFLKPVSKVKLQFELQFAHISYLGSLIVALFIYCFELKKVRYLSHFLLFPSFSVLWSLTKLRASSGKWYVFIIFVKHREHSIISSTVIKMTQKGYMQTNIWV